MIQESTESYTAEQASQRAQEFCDLNPTWQRICDIEDSDALIVPCSELPHRERNAILGYRADYWDEYPDGCYRPTRHRYGFVGGDGVFYDEIAHVPLGHNFMMVFQVNGGRRGRYYRGGQEVRSGLRFK